MQTAFFIFTQRKTSVTTKLSVTVAVNLDLTSVTISVAGLLSSQNVGGLLAVVKRAERILPDFTVRLDLEHLRSAAPEALHLLRQGATVLTADAAGVFNTAARRRESRLAA